MASADLYGNAGDFLLLDDDFEDEFQDELHRIKIVKPQIKRRYIILGICLVIIIVGVILAQQFGAFSSTSNANDKIKHGNGTDSEENGNETIFSPPDPTVALPSSRSTLHMFKRGAVCADGIQCAKIGNDILAKNGSAMDAAVAALFCNGLVTMQSMGLGGGFFMTYYDKATKRAYTIDAREVAPLKATADMFQKDPAKASKGPLSIGIPGELRGYWIAHKRFGKLPWKELMAPTIELCENGFPMTQHQYDSLFQNSRVKNDSTLYSWFSDGMGGFKKPGSIVQPKQFCETLKIIAAQGGDELYNGTLAKKFVQDFEDMGSIITAEDLEKYHARWLDPVNVTFHNGDVLYTMPPPGSGALLGFILNILDGYNLTRESMADIKSTVLTYHRSIEAFKYAYAKRTELGDTDFINITELIGNLSSRSYADDIRSKIMDNGTSTDPKHYGAVVFTNQNDHGTAHISILGPTGDAVSITSTVNLYFGAGIVGKRTGILLNNVMDDFSSEGFENYFGLPGSPNNKIEPGKRPLSSMSPSIVVDKNGDVKVVIGSSGGTKITTSLAYVLMRVLWMGDNIKEAVDAPRIHHQLYPMRVEYEYGVLAQVVKGLEELGHTTKRYTTRGSIVCALLRDLLKSEQIFANADFRKGGEVFGID